MIFLHHDDDVLYPVRVPFGLGRPGAGQEDSQPQNTRRSAKYGQWHRYSPFSAASHERVAKGSERSVKIVLGSCKRRLLWTGFVLTALSRLSFLHLNQNDSNVPVCTVDEETSESVSG